MAKSKYNRTMHLPWSPGTTSDDRIAPSVENLLEKEIVMTEKLDGENSGWTHEGVYARSHATFTTSPWSVMVRQMHGMLKRDIEPGTFLFGENMEGIHSIEYTNLTSPYYLFGIRTSEKWLSWEEVENHAFLMDIPTVPVLFKGICKTAEELKRVTEELVLQPSALGGKREGLVVRVANEFDDSEFSNSVMKWVRKGHVQTDEHWTRNWKRAKIKNYSI